MIPFSPPHYRAEALQEIEETLKSGWITTGPKTKLFEKNITEYCGNKVTNALNSATACMEMVLRYWGIGPGDEVIIPAYTYCATANVVSHVGAKPVMVDTRQDDFNMNVDRIRNAITTRTKVIVPVDIGGWPCDYSELLNVVESNLDKFEPNNDLQSKLGRVLIMSDSAHSFGASYKGQRMGSIADVTVFSFHAVKNLTTAEGGAICWNLPEDFDHDKIYNQINTMSLHGQSKDALAKTKAGGWRYDVDAPGYKCNMTDIHACLGLVDLKYYDETLAKRKVLFEKYERLLSAEPWAQVPLGKNESKESSYHLYNVRIHGCDEAQRNQIIELVTAKEVSVNVHFLPLPMLSAYSNRGYNIENFPQAYDNYSREISLPIYYDLTLEQVQIVVSALKESVESVLNG